MNTVLDIHVHLRHENKIYVTVTLSSLDITAPRIDVAFSCNVLTGAFLGAKALHDNTECSWGLTRPVESTIRRALNI